MRGMAKTGRAKKRLPGSSSAMSTKWRLVARIGFVLGLGEVIDSFFIGWGAIASVTFAILFFVGVWLTTRGHVAGPVLIAVMCALEIAAFPTFTRTSAVDWVVQVFFVVASAAGIISAVAAIVERRRGRVSLS